ncbi:hypothetical protein D3C72_1987370 [compost metagenome]
MQGRRQCQLHQFPACHGLARGGDDAEEHRIGDAGGFHQAGDLLAAQRDHLVGMRAWPEVGDQDARHLVRQGAGSDRIGQQIVEAHAAQLAQRMAAAAHEAGAQVRQPLHAQVGARH